MEEFVETKSKIVLWKTNGSQIFENYDYRNIKQHSLICIGYNVEIFTL